jgi:hypothetical protein
MNPVLIQALVRHLLTALGGGFLASYGLSGEVVEAAAGAIATLAGVAWSVYDKRNSTNNTKQENQE